VAGALLDRNNRARGAALGCAGGGALGGAAGYYVATRNDRYTTREQGAQARIAAARRDADDLQKAAAAADALTRQNRARLVELDRRYQAGELTSAEYRAEAASMRQDLAVIRDASSKSARMQAEMSQDAAVRQEERRVAAAQQRLDDSARQLEEALRRAPAG
jgi:hypothetical protein